MKFGIADSSINGLIASRSIYIVFIVNLATTHLDVPPTHSHNHAGQLASPLLEHLPFSRPCYSRDSSSFGQNSWGQQHVVSHRSRIGLSYDGTSARCDRTGKGICQCCREQGRCSHAQGGYIFNQIVEFPNTDIGYRTRISLSIPLVKETIASMPRQPETSHHRPKRALLLRPIVINPGYSTTSRFMKQNWTRNIKTSVLNLTVSPIVVQLTHS